MAQIIKRLCLPVGSYTKRNDPTAKANVQYREIGYVIEFENDDGNKWQEIQLNIDALSPVLANLAMKQVPKNESTARVKLFDVQRKSKPSSGTSEEEAPPAEDDIPF